MPTPAPAREIELIAHLEATYIIDAPFARFNDAGTHALITDEAVLARIDREKLSPSTFKVLSECVGKWAITKTIREPESVFKANSMGTEAHQLFEDMFNLHPSLRTMAWMKNAIEVRADELFAIDGEDIYQPLSAMIEPESMDEAMALLRQRWVYEVTANARGMWQNEKPAEIAVYQNEMSFDGITIGGAPAGGFIDRITVDLVSMGVDPKSLVTMSDEELRALAVRAAELGFLKANDWKTGKVGAVKYSKGYHDQLRVYATAIKAKTGKYPVSAELDYTKAYPKGDDALLRAYGYAKVDKRPTKGTKVRVDIRPVAVRKTDREFGQAWVKLRSHVDEASFPLEAGILCGWCPLVAVCPAAKAAGKKAMLDTLPTAEQVTIGNGEPLPYQFGRFGRIAEGTQAKPQALAAATTIPSTTPSTTPAVTATEDNYQEPFMSEQDFHDAPMGDEVYDDPADRIIAATDVPVPEVNENIPVAAPRAKRATKGPATDPNAPDRTSQRTPRTRSSGQAAALEDAPAPVQDEPFEMAAPVAEPASVEPAAVAEAPAAVEPAAEPAPVKAPAKARTPRVTAKAKAAAALAEQEAAVAAAQAPAPVEAVEEVAPSSADQSPEEAAQPAPVEEVPALAAEPEAQAAAAPVEAAVVPEVVVPEAVDQVAAELAESVKEAKALVTVMTELRAQLHLAKEVAGAAVKARNEASIPEEAETVAEPIKLSRNTTGAIMITELPILSEDKSNLELSGKLLNPSSPAARAVFATSSWALKMLVFEGQKVTTASLGGLTSVLGNLIVRLHSEFSDDPKWSDGGNGVVRDVLRSVVPDVAKPWGGTAQDWEKWGEKVFKRARLVLLTGYVMYSEGVADTPYADLAAATAQDN